MKVIVMITTIPENSQSKSQKFKFIGREVQVNDGFLHIILNNQADDTRLVVTSFNLSRIMWYETIVMEENLENEKA